MTQIPLILSLIFQVIIVMKMTWKPFLPICVICEISGKNCIKFRSVCPDSNHFHSSWCPVRGMGDCGKIPPETWVRWDWKRAAYKARGDIASKMISIGQNDNVTVGSSPDPRMS